MNYEQDMSLRLNMGTEWNGSKVVLSDMIVTNYMWLLRFVRKQNLTKLSVEGPVAFNKQFMNQAASDLANRGECQEIYEMEGFYRKGVSKKAISKRIDLATVPQ